MNGYTYIEITKAKKGDGYSVIIESKNGGWVQTQYNQIQIITGYLLYTVYMNPVLICKDLKEFCKFIYETYGINPILNIEQ